MSTAGVAGPSADAQPRLDAAARLVEAGAYADALALLDRLASDRPDDAGVHAARGWALENLEPVRLDEARAAYETAIALDPDELWASVGLATVLERLGHARRGAEIHRDLVERAGPQTANAPELLELLGWCLYRLDRLDDAADTFARALRLDPDWVSVRFDLGLVLLRGGDVDAAAAQFERALHSLQGRPTQARAAALRLALEDLDDASRRQGSAGPAIACGLRARLTDALDRCHA